MFNYSFNVRRLNGNSNLKAFVTLIVDDVMSIDGFKVVDGRNGLFVSAPSHKGTVMEDGVQKEKYFDDVRFLGENGLEVGTEIKNAMLDAYHNNSGSTAQQGGRTWGSKQQDNSQQTRANAAAANTAVNSNPPKRNKKRAALWEDA
tara:strand:+ start:2039 stop:2476 length:438 start_codon:yes stop_codon:yes gene_type:complete